MNGLRELQMRDGSRATSGNSGQRPGASTKLFRARKAHLPAVAQGASPPCGWPRQAEWPSRSPVAVPGRREVSMPLKRFRPFASPQRLHSPAARFITSEQRGFRVRLPLSHRRHPCFLQSGDDGGVCARLLGKLRLGWRLSRKSSAPPSEIQTRCRPSLLRSDVGASIPHDTDPPAALLPSGDGAAKPVDVRAPLLKSGSAEPRLARHTLPRDSPR